MDISKYKSRGGKSGRELLEILRGNSFYSRGPAFYLAWDKDTAKEEVSGFNHGCHAGLMSGKRNYTILGGLFGDRYTGPQEEANRYWAWLFGEDRELSPPYPDVIKNIHKVWKDKRGNYIGFFLDLTECNCEAVRHWLIMSRGPHEMDRTVRGWNMLVEGGVHPVFALWLAHQAFYVKRKGHGKDRTKWQFFLGTNAGGHVYMPEIHHSREKLKSLDLETVFKPGTRLYKKTKRENILSSLTKRMTRAENAAWESFKKNLQRSRHSTAKFNMETSFGFLAFPEKGFVPMKTPESEGSEKEKDTRPKYQILIEAALKLQKELHDVA